jgi:putative glutamine amidotransferase
MTRDRMTSAATSRAPRWYTIPVRVGLVTFIGTLLCFAVILFFAIFGTVILASLRGVHPDMRTAYRHIALPMAVIAGCIILVLALVMEIRHYHQAKTLSAIERMGWPAAPRIAIPIPHSADRKYGERAIPQYERAVALAGGEPVRVSLDLTQDEILKLLQTCDGVLLPGSKADVDPARFHAARSPHTAAADPRRDEVDDLLLDDAYRQRKPVLGICYGLQSLNVYRSGSLVQHIPEFRPEAARAKVDHEAGRKVPVAHSVAIDPNSRLAQIVGVKNGDGPLVVPVNSSHHQSAEAIGKGLRAVARCPDDGIIEALEGIAPDHFVLAVQWHPERSADDNAASRAIFSALIDAASQHREKLAGKTMS